MRTDRRWSERLAEEPATEEPGTKVLVAVEGFFEPGRECLPGELLWPTDWCGDRRCICGDLLHGITTHGNASVARVQVLRGAARALLESVFATAMRGHEGFDRPDAAAAAFLDEVAGMEEGRLVRREEGILLPFPMAARVVGGHHIEYHLSDEP